MVCIWGGSAKVAQVLSCKGEDAGLPDAKEDEWGGSGGSTAKRDVVSYTTPYCWGFESTQLARRVQPKRTQMEAQ